MKPGPGLTVRVFHAGALGDFVLCWPLLRALKRSGAEVHVVTHGAKARLAERELGVGGVDIERREFTDLWVQGSESSLPTRPRRVGSDEGGGGAAGERVVVVSFIADQETDGGRAWIANARRAFGAQRVECVGPPGSESRGAVWEWARVNELGGVEARENPTGPIVCHVGAGSREKMWPLERWGELVREVCGRGEIVDVLAGEVELERFTASERALFAQLGGVFEHDLQRLADRIRAARMFVGADTGPTHLAAQLGVRTVALFGPTDPAVWGPVGASVRVLAPESSRGMPWLGVERVLAALEHTL